jgi:hypothetical protein
MRRIRSRLTYANVMASLALFVALGGVGYAASQLPKNSVGTKQLKNGAVTEKKISKSAKKALAGTGTVGPVGPAGPPGAPAPTSARAYARVSPAGLDAAHSKGVIAVVPTCEPGEGSQECTAPPPEDLDGEWVRFCFKLGFVPTAIEVTPVMGRSYAPDAAIHVEARAPAGNPSSVYEGCKKGYDDAEVRAWKGEPGGFEGEPAGPGFFVVFY